MVEQMKPSGIDWIGDIPQSWIISKIKYNTIIPLTDGPHETPVFVDEGVPFYSVDGIQDDNIIYEPCRYISIEDANRFNIKVKPQLGDILMGKAASVGKIAIIDKDVRMQVWSPLAVIRTDETKVHNRYLRYYLLSSSAQVEIDLKSTSNTQKNIAMEDIENITIIKPEIKEQKAIADFLDKQCGKIDSIISDLEKQIETLQKYKMSLITETVTKGLRKATSMKKSGVNSILDIPWDWSVKKLKYVARLKTGTTPAGNEGINYDNQGVHWFTPSDFTSSLILDNAEKTIDSNAIHRENISLYPANSVLLVAIGATVGKIGITKKVAYSNQQITAIIPTKIYSEYLLYYLFSKSEYIKDNALYTTLPIINNGYLSNLQITIPPEEEQKEIAEFLNNKCNLLNEIIEDKQEQLEKIKQHKKSLIYEYVTGKKRVKEATNGN